jgi:hypothetical protein
LFFVKRYFRNMAGVSGVQSLASARPIRLILIKRRPVAAEMSDYRNLPAKMGTAHRPDKALAKRRRLLL